MILTMSATVRKAVKYRRSVEVIDRLLYSDARASGASN